MKRFILVILLCVVNIGLIFIFRNQIAVGEKDNAIKYIDWMKSKMIIQTNKSISDFQQLSFYVDKEILESHLKIDTLIDRLYDFKPINKWFVLDDENHLASYYEFENKFISDSIHQKVDKKKLDRKGNLLFFTKQVKIESKDENGRIFKERFSVYDDPSVFEKVYWNGGEIRKLFGFSDGGKSDRGVIKYSNYSITNTSWIGSNRDLKDISINQLIPDLLYYFSTSNKNHALSLSKKKRCFWNELISDSSFKKLEIINSNTAGAFLKIDYVNSYESQELLINNTKNDTGEQYNGLTIHQLNCDLKTNEDEFEVENLTYYTLIEQSIVFCSSLEQTHQVIELLNQNTSSELIPILKKFISKNSSTIKFKYESNLDSKISLYQNYALKDSIFVETIANFYPNNIEIEEIEIRDTNIAVTDSSSIEVDTNIKIQASPFITKWKTKFDTKLYPTIHLVKNHREEGTNVIVQDQNNKIYLVNEGDILWDKEIDGQIIGKIKVVDYLKNNKYQFLFNTSEKVYLVDVLGRDVKGFPFKLVHPSNNSLAIFDYDNNENYRFVVSTKENTIDNYDQNGNLVNGWNNYKLQSEAFSFAQHLLIENKDYIFQLDKSGKIHLLNRRGESRYEIKELVNAPINANFHFYIHIGNTIENSGIIYLNKDHKIEKLTFGGKRVLSKNKMISSMIRFNKAGGIFSAELNSISFTDKFEEEIKSMNAQIDLLKSSVLDKSFVGINSQNTIIYFNAETYKVKYFAAKSKEIKDLLSNHFSENVTKVLLLRENILEQIILD